MFKKPPLLKPLTPLRTSSRRAFLAHLQALYPLLALASAERILLIVPIGFKQCSATTSANQKVVIYTDETGKPLWFELGPNAGAALQQSQKKKSSQASPSKLAEVFPTVYALWLLPNLVPRLPTWPQVMDPTLLGGSALMLPGLIPPPNTFPEAEQQDGVYPPSHTIISITAYPSTVPLVVARSERDMKDLCTMRASGEKGKAATTIHTMGDCLWEMGGSLSPPSQEEVDKIDQELASAKVAGDAGGLEQQVGGLTVESNTSEASSAEAVEKGIVPNVPYSHGEVASEPSFTEKEVDAILYVALLQSLSDLSKQPDQLPMSISSLYSAHVLPNRPAHWPPRDAKGKKASQLSRHLVVVDGDGNEKLVSTETVDIKRTYAKKLSKWIKMAEKNDLLKCKDVKGKDTIFTWVNGAHADLQSLPPYYTIAQAQRDTASSTESQGKQTDVTLAAPKKTVVIIERFWKANASSVKLFQEMGASTSEPLSLPVIRSHLHDYIAQHHLVDARNQAQIRLEDPILVHALYPKAKLHEVPASLSRQEIVNRLTSTSCVEYHRTSRLSPERAAQVHLANTRGNPAQEGRNGILLAERHGEYVGALSAGAAKPVQVDIKSRQGRKAVSLVTGLEAYGIDPHALAHDIMKLGATARASALPTSTAKNPRCEVFVQGDQRKAIYEFVERNGLDRKYVHLHDGVKK